MKYKSLPLFLSFITVATYAQVPEDALKYSWSTPFGTARNQAIGGAAGSLGGDISSLFINPAGLGFYKTAELVVSPGLSMLSNNSNFRGTGTSASKSAFNLGASGFVLGGMQGQGSSSSAFAIGITRTANFNSTISYKGQNNFSSYGEQFAAEIANSGLSISDVLNSSSVSLQSRMALYTYLVDTASIPGHTGQDVISMAMWNSLKNGAPFNLLQENHVQTSGGISELGFGYAINTNDKFYIGGSIGLSFLNYQKQSTFTESDATGNNNNNFSYSELTETITTKGLGFNAKFGAIYNAADNLRLGLAFYTPTIYAGMTDTYEGSMTTNTQNYPPSPGVVTVNTSTFTGSSAPTPYNYTLSTPWRAMLSGSYVIGQVSDVSKQKGFITADIEYINYKSNKYGNVSDDADITTNDPSYYDAVNKAIKDYYKGAFNFRVGGELKFTTLMARMGFAYYGDPYKDSELNAHKMFASAGLGYRDKGIFIDLAYVLGLNKDVNFPYRLPDKANTFATVNGTGGNIVLTLGTKF
ncbi:MAG TPA: aromatic hydrocarbon degradation protein [Chitinophagaceae bacterium]|jgi:hypothetical protein